MAGYSNRFDQAMLLASELHRRQLRKGANIPYITHLLAVAALVGEHGGDEDEVIAALLHDAIEDQGGDAARRQIRAAFGDRVTAIVDGCTDCDTGEPKPPWKARKLAYIRAMEQAPPSVRLVSAADKLHNLRCLLADYRVQGELVWSKFNAGRDDILWYYRSLHDIYSRSGPTALADELARVLRELEQRIAAGNPNDAATPATDAGPPLHASGPST